MHAQIKLCESCSDKRRKQFKSEIPFEKGYMEML